MPFRDHVRGLARLVGRVVEHALGTVTNDVLMKYSQSLRANGSDQVELGPGEGRQLSSDTLRRNLKQETLSSLMDEFLGVLW